MMEVKYQHFIWCLVYKFGKDEADLRRKLR